MSLILVAVFVAIVLYRSQADETRETATVTNATPTIDSVYTSLTPDNDTEPTTDDAAISLIDHTWANVYFHGQATDLNGCSELTSATSSWFFKFYRTNGPGSGGGDIACLESSADCSFALLPGDSVTYQCDGGTDTVLTYETVAPIDHNYTPTDAGSANSSTDWTIKVSVTDSPLVGEAKTSLVATDTFEINTLLALDIGVQSLAFGELLLGGTSNQVVLGIENSGNVDIDLDIYSTDWSCGIGTMSASQTHYALTSGGNYATMTALSTTSSNVNISILSATSFTAWSDDGTESSSTLYFKLKV
ncbi:MAG: hypothetical protein Q7R79_01395, partial [bacterium]|nr:hypothetical protein [bacterium]